MNDFELDQPQGIATLSGKYTSRKDTGGLTFGQAKRSLAAQARLALSGSVPPDGFAVMINGENILADYADRSADETRFPFQYEITVPGVSAMRATTMFAAFAEKDGKNHKIAAAGFTGLQNRNASGRIKIETVATDIPLTTASGVARIVAAVLREIDPLEIGYISVGREEDMDTVDLSFATAPRYFMSVKDIPDAAKHACYHIDNDDGYKLKPNFDDPEQLDTAIAEKEQELREQLAKDTEQWKTKICADLLKALKAGGAEVTDEVSEILQVMAELRPVESSAQEY